MTEGERIRKVRKSKDLTLEKFGNILGVSKVAISNIENGNRNVTEQMRKSISREFHVDYDWLLDGIGDEVIFTKSIDEITEKEEYIEKVFANESPFARRVLKALAKFTPEEWERLEHWVNEMPKIVAMVHDMEIDEEKIM